MIFSSVREKSYRNVVLPMLFGVIALAGCASSPEMQSGVEGARSQLNELKQNELLADRAPIALREAETAVAKAEQADLDSEEGEHLVFMAENKVAVAEARAWKRYYDDERQTLIEERDRARLMARTNEAERARQEARQATLRADASQEETEQLQRQIDELNAQPTDRGLVLTLREVLFETNESALKAGAHADLDRLANFLKEYDERNVRIEGHTDSTGDESYNRNLSQRRAEAVKEYLVSQGIESRRVVTTGRGEAMPVASNNTASGRQLNRRVEILIENPAMARTDRRRR